MKLASEQLATHLQKQLLPVYLLTGQETLLISEAAQHLRTVAQQQGFAERIVHRVGPGFSWELFRADASTLSLFSSKTLLELHLDAAHFTEAAKEALTHYMTHLPADKVLLICTEKLEAKQMNTNWYKRLDQQGAVVQFWPLNGAKLSQWLTQRLRTAGLILEPAALSLLLELTEGNLLASHQAVEKLKLTYGKGTLTVTQITAALGDNSHFDLFKLVDHLLAGQSKRSLTILQKLQQEGMEPVLITWALVRELRQWITLRRNVEQGQSLAQVLASPAIWESKKVLFKKALQRHSVMQLYHLLQEGSRIDRLIKGAETGNVWLALSQWCMRWC